MTPFKRKFEKVYAKTLLKIAIQELETVRSLLIHPAGRPETVCFLAQQVIEKVLKAVICHLDQPIPMIHDLSGLIAAVPEAAGRPPRDTQLVGLTEFATVRRYEEGQYQLTPAEIKASVSAAEEVVEWGKYVISK